MSNLRNVGLLGAENWEIDGEKGVVFPLHLKAAKMPPKCELKIRGKKVVKLTRTEEEHTQSKEEKSR